MRHPLPLDSNSLHCSTANYRLNEFGFLGSAQLQAESEDGSTGNFGLQDQRAAMQVLRNIAPSIGGDVSRFTIFGESAGAGSVSNHLVAKRSWGLYNRAIAESGPEAQWVAQPFEFAQAKFDHLAHNLGCNTSDSESLPTQTPAEVIACMRTKNVSEIQAGKHGLVSGLVQWSPVVDGVELTDLPFRIARDGGMNPDADVMFGTNADEGTLFIRDVPHDMTDAGYLTYLHKQLGKETGDLAYALYPSKDFIDPWWAGSRVLGDSQMSCAARRSVRWAELAHQRAGSSAKSFLYFFAHPWLVIDLVQTVDPDERLGVCHGSELLGVFDLTIGMWDDAEKELGKSFVRYWTNFAINGVPSSAGDPVWPAYSNATDMALQLDTGANLTAVGGLKEPYCDFWDEHMFLPWAAIFGNLTGPV